MPFAWADIWLFFQTFGFWFVVAAILSGLFIKYIVFPFMSQRLQDHKQAVCQIDHIYSSIQDPINKDIKGRPVIITRADFIQAIKESKDVLIKFCDASHCPVVPVFTKEFHETRKALDDHIKMLAKTRESFLHQWDKFVDSAKTDNAMSKRELEEYAKEVVKFSEAALAQSTRTYEKIDNLVGMSLAKSIEIIEKLAEDRRTNGGK